MSTPTSFAVHRPGAALRGLVTGLVGFELTQVGLHLGLPSRSLTLIVPIGTATVVSGPVLAADDNPVRTPTAFDGLLGGLHDRAVTLHPGRQAGLQLDVTPAGARALFGMPAGELSGRLLPLEVLAPELARASARLAELDAWPARFDLVEKLLLARLDPTAPARARERSPQTWQAWRLLAASHGRLRVQEVADRVGWSRRHLVHRFQTEFGHPPKTLARVMRFEHSRHLLVRPGVRLADVAQAAGFADQAHLTREWRAVTGLTPAGWLRAESPPPARPEPPQRT